MPHVVGEYDVAKEAVSAHHDGWDRAMEDALDKAKRLGFGGQNVNIEFSAELTANPSQIQRYIVTVS
jgi:hypothetical protein